MKKLVTMISKSRLFLAIFLISVTTPAVAEELHSMSINYEQWEASRHGEKLLKLADLTELVQLWSENTGKILEIRYPGGEQGELWSQQLMDWLIALAVPSSSMQAIPGSGNKDIIKIVLIQGKQTNE